MIDASLYDGRGQALVKHTFLDKYMPDQLPKIVHWADEFVYVDLFAGPWQARSDDFADTSFGIALRHLSQAKAAQAALGRKIKVSAHLVEKDPLAFQRLTGAASLFPDVNVRCYHGRAEDHAQAIASSIGTRAFRFVVIDPKGVPDVRQFKCLIEPDRSEVLLNFMFEFANRFAHTRDRMPTLEGWLRGLSDDDSWRNDFADLRGEEREVAITTRARPTIQRMGNYQYAPAITVDESDVDRPLYKLIYLTRHHVGLRVFRDAHLAALKAQASYRTVRKQELREAKTGMGDLFAGTRQIEPNERSAVEMSRGADDARAFVREVVKYQREQGVLWRELWPRALDACVTTHRQLADVVGKLRDDGEIVVPAWTSRQLKIPKDDYRLYAAKHVPNKADPT